jgi:hypothetical protein
MPAIALIGLGISAYSAYKQGKAASAAASAQNAVAQQQSDLAKELMGQGQSEYNMGAPALSKAMQYYTTLATGGRGAISNALAPSMNALADTYGGAEKGMNERMAPGPTRDRAIAELYRQKAGQMGLMPFQARQGAIGQLGTMGQGLMTEGGKTMQSASGVFNSSGQMSGTAGQNQANAWGAYGNMAGDITKAVGGAWDIYKNRRSGSTPPYNQSQSPYWMQ